jgi:hypothetical protein
MTTGLIILLELGLFSLLLLLAFRVISLNRNEPLASAMPGESPIVRESEPWFNPTASGQFTDTRTDKCELISQLHILAGLQVRDCRQQGLDLETAHSSVREYAVCWLYGAACQLSPPGSRHSDGVAGLVSQSASRKFGIRQSEAVATISTLTRQSAALACFRSGIEGAEFWKTRHFVPRENSLFEAVTSNTFV